MPVDTLFSNEAAVARNDMLKEVLLRNLAKGAWGDGRPVGDEERDYMVISVGEHHTRQMSNDTFGRYVMNRFGFYNASDIRYFAYNSTSGMRTIYPVRDALDAVYSSIGEDILDQYVNMAKGVEGGIDSAA